MKYVVCKIDIVDSVTGDKVFNVGKKYRLLSETEHDFYVGIHGTGNQCSEIPIGYLGVLFEKCE